MLAWSILCAFGLGLAARRVGLPPLIGFLAAGFLLNAFGVEPVPAVSELGEIGVWLLLFPVGLKLRFKSLIRPEVWGTALVHLAIAGSTAAVLARGQLGLDWAPAWIL